MIRLRRLPTPSRRVLAAVVTVLVLAAFWTAGENDERTATAYFTQVKGLYEGDDVQVIGVPVGRITKITPEPGRVRVDFIYDADRPIPADAKAVIMAPSVVPVRNLTLAPVYRGGPQFEDGAVIPESRTAVPVEWDEIKDQLNDLAMALGPDGANSSGALSRALDTTAKNLKGQGTSLNQTLTAMSEAMATIADGGEDLFATVRNLQVFADALNRSDRQVVEFNQRLASVSEVLDGSSDDLGTALRGLNRAFTHVEDFLRKNRPTLSAAVRELRPLADILASKRQEVADLLQFGPTALSNFNNIYDPLTGTWSGSVSLANLQSPAVLVCSAIFDLGGTPEQCQAALEPLAKLATIPPPPAGVSPYERNTYENLQDMRPGAQARGGGSSTQPDLADLLLPGGER